MKVRLTDDEVMFARHLGALELAEMDIEPDNENAINFIRNGHKHGAHMAVCKALNLYPNLSTKHRDLISRTGKRVGLIYTPDPSFLYPIDGKHDVYVAINGNLPEYELVGYTMKEAIGNSRGIQPKNMFKFTESDICTALIAEA